MGEGGKKEEEGGGEGAGEGGRGSGAFCGEACGNGTGCNTVKELDAVDALVNGGGVFKPPSSSSFSSSSPSSPPTLQLSFRQGNASLPIATGLTTEAMVGERRRRPPLPPYLSLHWSLNDRQRPCKDLAHVGESRVMVGGGARPPPGRGRGGGGGERRGEWEGRRGKGIITRRVALGRMIRAVGAREDDWRKVTSVERAWRVEGRRGEKGRGAGVEGGGGDKGGGMGDCWVRRSFRMGDVVAPSVPSSFPSSLPSSPSTRQALTWRSSPAMFFTSTNKKHSDPSVSMASISLIPPSHFPSRPPPPPFPAHAPLWADSMARARGG